jgi:hypothetical protein
MGKGRSWLVERLNRRVQIPIERMGFGQRGWLDVSRFKRGSADLCGSASLLSIRYYPLSKRHPLPLPLSVALGGLTRNFSSPFWVMGF